jgi:hypothetical protein
MISNSRIAKAVMILRMVFVLTGCAIVGGIIASVSSASANEFYEPHPYAAEPCGRATQDPAGLAPSGGCMRYGGHVRVESGARAVGTTDRSWGAAPAAMRTNRLRLPDDMAHTIMR